MQALRRSAGADTTLLGCGLPLGAGLGLVEAMRIGADVSDSWKPSYFGMGFPFRKEPHMPCARNSIQNILVRAGMHNRWWVNDPDCLLVRPDSRLNLEEVRTLATAIGMTGGSVLLSDNMNELPEDRLEMVAALLPPVKKAVQVIDWLDEETPRKLKLDLRAAAGDWCVLAYFNWRDKADDCSLSAADFRLPEGAYWVRSFWDQRVWKALEGGALYQGRLAAHAALVLAVRPYKEKQAAYLGSSLHISQGLEVSGWQSGRNALEIQFSPGRQAMAGVDVYIPVNVREAFFDGKPADWKKMDAGVHRFSLEMARQNNLTIKY